MVVVFPVPFIPTKTMTYDSFSIRFSSTAFSKSISSFVVIVSKSTSLRFSFTISLRSSSLLTWTPSRRFSISLQIRSATGRATSFSIRLNLKSDRTGCSFSALSSVVVTLITSLFRPFFSLSNILRCLPLTYFVGYSLEF